ncbi:MAG: DUF2235 domain-containing protein [Deltaproteobacteria bacterium]|nr:DUF2235 domain-containing protein [Deltaproteobacteria bacterium]
MSKQIIFCADGTWNGPDKDDDGDKQPDVTNVYKLFLALTGSLSVDTIRDADEQEKVLSDGARPTQVAKYIHGVGDSRNPLVKLMGGAFGSGIITRIVRGYTFISRNYEAGDGIVITGFSRGAYTARALAGLIVSQGLLAKPLTQDKTAAYRLGARVWYRYRQQSNAPQKPTFLARLAEAAADLPGFLSRDEVDASQLIAVDKLKSVAVWDTVGAMGLPLYMNDKRIDAFKFTNTSLSTKVENGFHAVALDEQRGDFMPTLWDPAANVKQVAFASAHADVGGGYTTNNHESELSDIALEWMVGQLESVGVKFNRPIFTRFSPNPEGTAHKPWTHPPFNAGKAEPRKFARTGVTEHPSIATRMKAAAVVHEPKEAPAPYRPTNRP